MLEIRISIERAPGEDPLRRMMVFSWAKRNGEANVEGLLIAHIDSGVERFRVAARLAAGLALAYEASMLSLIFSGRKNAWGKWSHWKVNGESEVLGELKRVRPGLVTRVDFE